MELDSDARTAMDAFLDEEYSEEKAQFREKLAQWLVNTCERRLVRLEVPVFCKYRVKARKSMRNKLEKLWKQEKWHSLEDIRNIENLDLVGMRLCLYFPSQVKEVERMLKKDAVFNLIRVRDFQEFGYLHRDQEARPYAERAGAYDAKHFWIELDRSQPEIQQELPDYGGEKVEIQVRGVLMNAWAEMRHDIDYKVLSGYPNQAELRILDAIKGGIMSLEIMSEQLKSAHDKRLLQDQRRFATNRTERFWRAMCFAIQPRHDFVLQHFGEGSKQSKRQTRRLFDLFDVHNPGTLKRYLADLDSPAEQKQEVASTQKALQIMFSCLQTHVPNTGEPSVSTVRPKKVKRKSKTKKPPKETDSASDIDSSSSDSDSDSIDSGYDDIDSADDTDSGDDDDDDDDDSASEGDSGSATTETTDSGSGMSSDPSEDMMWDDSGEKESKTHYRSSYPFGRGASLVSWPVAVESADMMQFHTLYFFFQIFCFVRQPVRYLKNLAEETTNIPRLTFKFLPKTLCAALEGASVLCREHTKSSPAWNRAVTSYSVLWHLHELFYAPGQAATLFAEGKEWPSTTCRHNGEAQYRCQKCRPKIAPKATPNQKRLLDILAQSLGDLRTFGDETTLKVFAAALQASALLGRPKNAYIEDPLFFSTSKTEDTACASNIVSRARCAKVELSIEGVEHLCHRHTNPPESFFTSDAWTEGLSIVAKRVAGKAEHRTRKKSPHLNEIPLPSIRTAALLRGLCSEGYTQEHVQRYMDDKETELDEKFEGELTVLAAAIMFAPEAAGLAVLSQPRLDVTLGGQDGLGALHLAVIFRKPAVLRAILALPKTDVSAVWRRRPCSAGSTGRGKSGGRGKQTVKELTALDLAKELGDEDSIKIIEQHKQT